MLVPLQPEPSEHRALIQVLVFVWECVDKLQMLTSVQADQTSGTVMEILIHVAFCYSWVDFAFGSIYFRGIFIGGKEIS